MQNAAKSLLTDPTWVLKAPKVPWLLAARRLVMQVEARFLSSPSFFPSGSEFPSPQRRRKVVCKAKRPKSFGSPHGELNATPWACPSGLSGAQNGQRAREQTCCSQSPETWVFGSCVCVKNHLLRKAKRWSVLLRDKPSPHPPVPPPAAKSFLILSPRHTPDTPWFLHFGK